MGKINLKGIKISFPSELENNFNEQDVVEWLEYNLGLRSDIRIKNQLYDIELSDCIITIENATINGKEISI